MKLTTGERRVLSVQMALAERFNEKRWAADFCISVRTVRRLRAVARRQLWGQTGATDRVTLCLRMVPVPRRSPKLTDEECTELLREMRLGELFTEERWAADFGVSLRTIRRLRADVRGQPLVARNRPERHAPHVILQLMVNHKQRAA